MIQEMRCDSPYHDHHTTSKANLKCVLFDLGNVMWDDSIQDVKALGVLREALEGNGIAVSDTQWRTELTNMIQSHAPRILWGLMVRLTTADSYMDVKETYEDLMLEFLEEEAEHEETLRPWRNGAKEFLDFLSDFGVEVGIVTNNRRGISSRFKKIGRSDVIGSWGVSAETGMAKPDTRLFQQVLDDLGCSATESVMIGDRLDNDISPANRIGCYTIQMRNGLHKDQRPRSPLDIPCLRVDTFGELIDAILL